MVAAIRGANSRTASFLGPPSDHLRPRETSREESQRPSSHAEQDVPIWCGFRYGRLRYRIVVMGVTEYVSDSRGLDGLGL